MSFCISFQTRSPTLLRDGLEVVNEGKRADDNLQSPIVVRVAGHLVGHADCASKEVTAFVSGSFTNVPAPHRAGTGADAARVLASLYEHRSIDAFSLIDGAFCAAVLDWRRGAIVLARDKLGIGRAYLHQGADRITFSDRISHVLSAERRPFELDINSVFAFLTLGWVPTPHSMFLGIEKLSPGTVLVSEGGELTRTTYYDVPHSPHHVVRRAPNTVKELVVEHLDRSVARGMALGGRWGSFLSGGVDSSSVVASLAKADPASLHTYFGGFDQRLNHYLPNPEEPEMSQLVADRCGTEHHMLWLGDDAIGMTSEIVAALEEPVCDGGCVVVGAVMQAARSHVDGLMTGIGGDFLFTGERRHMVLNLLRYLRPIPDFLWTGLLWVSSPGSWARGPRISQMHFDLTRLMSVRGLDLEKMYAGFYLQAEPAELEELLSPEALRQVTRDPFQEMNDCFQCCSELDPLSRFLYLDLKTQCTDHCSRETETLGRHFGLNTHNPFLDAEFVDFAMSIPSSAKVSRLTLKVPLKEAMRGRVPDQVLDRKKGGLGSPIRWWVTEPDGPVARVLSRPNIDRRGLFSADAVERMRKATASNERDYSKLLWSLFTLELWMREFVDQNAGSAR